MNWLQVAHDPKEWDHELIWMMNAIKQKNWRAKALKEAFVETVYECWKYKNDKLYNNSISNINIGQKVIDILANRLWIKPKLREYVSQMLVRYMVFVQEHKCLFVVGWTLWVALYKLFLVIYKFLFPKIKIHQQHTTFITKNKQLL